MRSLDRRDFMRISGSTSGLLALAAFDGASWAKDEPKVTAEKAGDVNSQLRVAVVGVRSRGGSHVGAFAGNKKLNTVVTTICDVDSAVVGKVIRGVEGKQKKLVQYTQDIRRVLDDKSIDIISVATPNHWHALASIWAMQAGKDVYVEKPVSHNVREGRIMVEVARKTNRICQTGTQSRSTQGMRDSMAFVHSGKIGTVKLSRGLCYKNRPSIGKCKGEQKPPASMDYDLWCGPAPLVMPKRNTPSYGTVHYDWHWIWDYGNGDLGNQGIHEMDKARWGLNKNTLPNSVVSLGGRYGYEDDGETANTQICLFDYGDAELIFEVRGLKSDKLKGVGVGNIFYGSEGYVVCPNYSSGVAYDKDGNVLAKFDGGGDGEHYENFIKAVRARNHELLNADILDGHLSSALCHLGNISYRLGKPTPVSEAPKFEGEAGDAVKRMIEHLEANKVSSDSIKLGMGRKLAIDPKNEKFVNDSEADALLFREYRKGFEVKA